MSSVANGGLAVSSRALPSSHTHADFYTKLARFESEVLTGRHPEYRLPKSDVDKLAAMLSSVRDTPWQSAQHLSTNGVSSVSTLQSATLPASRKHVAYPLPPRPPVAQDTQISSVQDTRPPPVQKASQIDPVLLTKSDNLLRAEMRLKLQREEIALKNEREREREQIRKEVAERKEKFAQEKRRIEALALIDTVQREEEALKDKRESIEQALNGSVQVKNGIVADKAVKAMLGSLTFSGTVVLDKALALVKPVSGMQIDIAENNNSDSSSFGDGYYSSKGGSWSPDVTNHSPAVGASAQPSIPNVDNDGLHSKTHVQNTAMPPKGRVSGLGPPNIVTSNFALGDSFAVQPYADASESSGHNQDDAMDTEISREESYSPPAADLVDRMRHEESESYSPPPAAAPVVTERSANMRLHKRKKGNAPIDSETTNAAFPKKSKALWRAEQVRLRQEKKAAGATKQQFPQNQQRQGRKKRLQQANASGQSLLTHPLPATGPRQPFLPARTVRSRSPRIKAEPMSPPLRSLGPIASVAHAQRLPFGNGARKFMQEALPGSSSDSQAAFPGMRTHPPPRQINTVVRSVYPPVRPLDPSIGMPFSNHVTNGDSGLNVRDSLWVAVPDDPAANRRRRQFDPEPIWIDSPDSQASPPRRRINQPLGIVHVPRPDLTMGRSLPCPTDETPYVRAPSQVIERRVSRQPRPHDVTSEVIEQEASHHGTDEVHGYVASIPDNYIRLPPARVRPSKPVRKLIVDENGIEYIATPTGYQHPVEPEVQYVAARERDLYDDQPIRTQSRPVSRAVSTHGQYSMAYDEDLYDERPIIRVQSRPVSLAPPVQALSHTLEQRQLSRQPTQLTERFEDTENRRRMPPPPARINVRKRPIEAYQGDEIDRRRIPPPPIRKQPSRAAHGNLQEASTGQAGTNTS